ncbi:MAG: molybdopterin-dependent oxidoreductase [Actinobacteria bacterium]|nr:molybdopterin-dependent oxidoreductase [Actinomycetota bacterium]
MNTIPLTNAVPPTEPPVRPIARRYGALGGFAAGALAVALGMFFAAITDVVSPIDAVGSEVIDRAPRWVKEFAIRNFGTDDKLALRIGIITILGIASLALGVAAIRRWWIGTTGIGLFGVVGAAAAVHRPGESGGAAVPSLLGAAIGAVVLHRLLRPVPVQMPGASQAPLGWDRRRFLITGGATVATAAFAGGIALQRENQRVSDLREAADVPLPSTPLSSAEIPPDAEVFDETPFVTPNGEFYRIDTALSFPRIDVATWSFDIGGMVDNPLTITYDDLLAMDQVERVITLCCVSNEVGGDLIGNAVWRGVLLRDLLEQAGVQPSAEQVFSTSLDGWTCGFPVAAAFDGRDVMVAVGMNGDTLPLEHGFPARLVVPGLYGYVSATKWLAKIKLTTWDEQGYWVPRGWSQQAPIKTQSRIDVVRAVSGTSGAAGLYVIAGVAWAQHRGVDKVEVSIDDGPWEEAKLGADVSDDAWRQWLLEWDAEAGNHRIAVRATDKTGETQTGDQAPPAPNGATGYHTIRVGIDA